MLANVLLIKNDDSFRYHRFHGADIATLLLLLKKSRTTAAPRRARARPSARAGPQGPGANVAALPQGAPMMAPNFSHHVFVKIAKIIIKISNFFRQLVL